MEITTKLDFREEPLLKEIFQNEPEYSQGCGLRCVEWDYDQMLFTFLEATGDDPMPRHVLDMEKAKTGLKLYLEHLAKKGALYPDIIKEAGYWDLDMTDAVVQFALLGELVYG